MEKGHPKDKPGAKEANHRRFFQADLDASTPNANKIHKSKIALW